ncbi:MAG: hypothetical protein SV765_05710 [Pseudomonadota bacterium]|nr:hypothetical protein [Pseudomonadales bacterium]MDY6919692.1 hypothetical protein [Pseudomonadota bacterium]
MSEVPNRNRRLLLLLLILVISGTCFYNLRLGIARVLLPYYSAVVGVMERRLPQQSMQVVRHGNEYRYSLRLASARPVELAGHQLPGMDVSATTLVTFSLQHLVIFTGVMAAAALFQRLLWWRLLLSVPLALLMSLGLDVPLVLLGSIEGLLLENLAPERLAQSLSVRWEQFITNGGRVAVALTFSLLCVTLARQPRRRPESAGKSD